MEREWQDPIEEQHGNWMDGIHRELWAFEGEGPPGDDALMTVLHDQLSGAIELLGYLEEDYDIPDDADDYISSLRGDLLKCYVAIQMIRGHRGKPDAFTDD